MKKILLIALLIELSLSAKSQNWSALNTGVDASVDALCVDSANNLLYVGGGFQNASGTPVYYVASWNGNNWAPVGTGLNGNAMALAMYNGELYAGGYFNFAGGNSSPYLARWNGTNWNAVSPLLTSAVTTLKSFNGSLYGVMSYTSIFKWDGITLSFIGGPGNQIDAIEFFNGYLIAGGHNSNYNYIAKWDTSAWSMVGNGFNNFVTGLTTYNGYLYAGGPFIFSGGTPINSIARWDGISWTALGSGISNGAGGGPTSISSILGYNNIIYAGGAFNYAGGLPASCIAKWDGNNWSTLGSGTINVVPMAIYKNDLYEGGGGQYAGGLLVNYIAKWAVSAGVENKTAESGFYCFPNPFNDKTVLKTDIVDYYNKKIQITDILGNIVSNRNIDAISDFEIERGDLNLQGGIYLVKIWDGQKLIGTAKLVAF